MNTVFWDILFILLLAAVLLTLIYLDWMDFVLKFPFIMILTGYFIGRYTTHLINKQVAKKQV
ncbi:MAG: hypothetical protein JXR71_10885 [Bacteroidales bacterium]|nr:hypothetical protein [Bacteroidales bacterium]